MIKANVLIEMVLEGHQPSRVLEVGMGQTNLTTVRATLMSTFGKQYIKKGDVSVTYVKNETALRIYAFEKTDADKAFKALKKEKWLVTPVQTSTNGMFKFEINLPKPLGRGPHGK